mgnify:CR=1 FL=1
MGPYDNKQQTLQAVRDFWNQHPLCSHLIDSPPGTEDFFREFDQMRASIEPDAFVEQMLAPSKTSGKRVLDVGCGNGYMLAKFARSGTKSFGIDLTAKALDITKQRMELSGLSVRLAQADAAALPFADSSFDMVYSLGVLHHSPDTEKSFREIHRVLRPGGKIVVMLYNKNSVFFRLRIPAMKFFNPEFRGWSIQEICNYLDGPGNPLGKFYSRSDVTAILEGFSTPRFQPFFFSHLHFPGKLDIFPDALCRFLGRRFGWFLYAKAYKI